MRERERETKRGKTKEEELESDCRKSEHNYNKRLSNILIQKRTKRYSKNPELEKRRKVERRRETERD